jgi:hypothetical protein
LVRIILEFHRGCHISQVKYGFSYGQAHSNLLSVPMDLVCGEDEIRRLLQVREGHLMKRFLCQLGPLSVP